jgi:hypothetical protein
MQGFKKREKSFGILLTYSYLCTQQSVISMEDKRYPVVDEEESVGMCCEPSSGYAATGSGYVNTLIEDEVAEVPLGKLGFYTEDMDEFEARVAEIEADLDEVENGNEDPQKWVTSEQFNQELYQEFPWLR